MPGQSYLRGIVGRRVEQQPQMKSPDVHLTWAAGSVLEDTDWQAAADPKISLPLKMSTQLDLSRVPMEGLLSHRDSQGPHTLWALWKVPGPTVP